MPAISKSGEPSISTGSPSFEHQFAGLIAGEAIAAGDACTINSSGKIMKRTEDTAFRGVAARATPAGDSATLWHGVNFHYGSGLTPGIEVYLDDAVAGGLNTTGTISVGFALDATRIHFYGLQGPYPEPVGP